MGHDNPKADVMPLIIIT